VTTCDEVRERLPEHVLGTLDETHDLTVRRHLRGCAGCRREMAALGDGVALFARAVHDRTPPPELKDRVGSALAQEWKDAPAAAPRRRSFAWLSAAASFVVVAAALSWGLVQHHRATVVAAEASSYNSLLSILGGKEFRIGTLQHAPGATVDGSVVAYDSSHDQSWVAVFVRAPGVTGTVGATLRAADGRRIQLSPMNIAQDGSGTAWLVTETNLEAFDRLTVTAPDGSILATAQINKA
jgi:hypothetical protein